MPRDVGPTRLAAARLAAGKHVASLRFRDEMAMIAAGTQPQGDLRTDEPRTHAAGRYRQHWTLDGPTQVIEAVQLAKRLLADAPHGQVIVFSDGGFAEPRA